MDAPPSTVRAPPVPRPEASVVDESINVPEDMLFATSCDVVMLVVVKELVDIYVPTMLDAVTEPANI